MALAGIRLVSAALFLSMLPVMLAAQTSPEQNPPAGPPPQAPIGVTPLPQDAPPTGLQAPLPAPVRPQPRANRPTLTSPTLIQIRGTALKRPLTIADAVALALATNRSLALSAEQLQLARGRVNEARAAFLPTLGATYNFSDLLQGGQVINFGSGSTTGSTTGSAPIVISTQYTSTFGAAATLPLDIAGLLRAAVDQARFQEIATRIDINRTRNQIVLDTKTAFYNVLLAQALVTVAQETLQNNLDRLSDAQKKYAAGTSAQFDVIRAQTDVANAQQQLIQAKTNVSLTIAQLNNTIGINVDAPIQVTEAGAVETPPGVAPSSVPASAPNGAIPNPNTPSPAPPVPTAPATPGTSAQSNPGVNTSSQAYDVRFDTLNLGSEYERARDEAVRIRPDILEQDANIAAARKGILLARRSVLPSLGLSLSGQYAPNAVGFAPQTTTGVFGIAISVPIFDAGVANARVQQARAQVAEAETNRRTAVDAVILEVRQAYLTLVQQRDNVAVANQALSQARESYRLARVRYDAGVSTLVEVSDAQAALTQAENNQVNALYNYNAARARLDKAVGRYAYVTTGPGYAAPPSNRETGRDRNRKEEAP